MRTTTTLALGPGGILVDPAWEQDELDGIADDLDGLGVRVTAGFSTHAHYDHLLWHPRFGGATPRWASSAAVAVVAAQRDALLDDLAADSAGSHDGAVRALFGRVTAMPDDDGRPGTRIPGPDGALPPHEVVTHDAHAPGHSALWLPGPGVLVAGDMLSDTEIPLPFDPDDLEAYLAGLDRLEPYVRAASVLVPGHGTPSYAPMTRLDADRRYLDAVLSGRAPDDPRLRDPGMADAHARVLRIAGR
ncbi:MBL fold metallo-hydrolase [Myceligenerans crystallogenes]|uniref:MBL fold metallo-hydrolase n=2 Tax=Myceligenerans crystallogenes TaxID=316335 RepID=A0ABP4ZED6_9MICO